MQQHTIMLTFLLFLAFAGKAQEPTKAQIQEVKEAKKSVRQLKGTTFPDFSLTNIAGESVTSAETIGKYVLFNFWFTRCRPCIEEIPELNEMVKEFAHREDVVFLAPTFDSQEQVQKFQQRFSFDYQLFPDEKPLCLAMNVRSYPTHFLVNPDGVIEKVIIGYSSQTVKALKKSLNKLLSAR